MRAEEYIQDPCRASALPFWKTEQVQVPERISVLREDEFTSEKPDGTDEPYFRLICYPLNAEKPILPADFETAACSAEEYAEHIREQWGYLGNSLDYTRERFTLDEGLNERGYIVPGLGDAGDRLFGTD